MPEIKIKHIVSFSSEDKVHKAENLLKSETYRKWKCATPGEKNATIILQFEKASQINSIDIGNESSAFVEVLVGRSSSSVNDFQVLLVASSFMSPIESRNGTYTNRVRMFGPEKLSQSTKDEKWDCVQIVCTQPFNKTVTYGLTFIKFHSPPEKSDELCKASNEEKSSTKLGAFKLKYVEDDDDDSLPSLGSWFIKEKNKASEKSFDSSKNQTTLSYAASVLASSSSASKISSQDNSQKRKIEEKEDACQEPPIKKVPSTTLNKKHISYKDVRQDAPESKRVSDVNKEVKKDTSSPKVAEKRKTPISTTPTSSPSSNNKPAKLRQKVPFNKLMDKVVFVLSGFVNPLRSELRDKALEMGAKYKADWDNSCTHLVCAFIKTPKYEQVKKLDGRIVVKEWILDCYRKKEPLLWKKYMLSSDSSNESDAIEVDMDDSDESYTEEDIDDSDEDEDYVVDKKKKKPLTIALRKKAVDRTRKKKPESPSAKSPAVKNINSPRNNIVLDAPINKQSNVFDNQGESSTPKKKNKLNREKERDESDNSQSLILSNTKSESETEDEEALQDYIADTDVEDENNDDTGGDTEDELQKFELKIQKKKTKMNNSNKDIEDSEKPDVADLPLPDLPNYFKQKHFFLFGEFPSKKVHELQRYITSYNGIIEDYMSDKIKYVITEKKWDKNFEDALSANEDLIFVKPTWIYKCHEAGKLMPYQPHIIIPDS